jgi:hypothetical protein
MTIQSFDVVTGSIAGAGYANNFIVYVRIYGTELTTAQIANIYNSGNGAVYTGVANQGGTAISAWALNEGSGTEALNKGSYNTSGTIKNNIAWVDAVKTLNDTNTIQVYYNIDNKGWVRAGDINATTNYEEYPIYINRTGKRIQFRFATTGLDFTIREYTLVGTAVKKDR